MVTLVLTCLGVIPFVTLAFLARDAEAVGMAMDKLLLDYSGVIMAFLAGTQWGMALSNTLPAHWFVQSNVIALLVCAGLFFGAPSCWPLFFICLWYCYGLDVLLWRRGLISSQYSICRLCVSLVVSVVFIGQWYI